MKTLEVGMPRMQQSPKYHNQLIKYSDKHMIALVKANFIVMRWPLILNDCLISRIDQDICIVFIGFINDLN